MGKGSYFIGDFVRVATKRSREFGRVSYVEKISGDHYKIADGFPYMAQELEPATRKEYEAYIEATELEATAQPAASATAADGGDGFSGIERLEAYRDIFHDVIAGHLESTPEVMAQRGLYLLKQIATLQAKLASAEAALAVAATRTAWADEILDTVEETAPKDWAGSTDPLPHDWYHAGQLVREYRAEYPKQATG